MELIKNFYIPGVHHKCQFCGRQLAKLSNNRLEPLTVKVHIHLSRADHGLYTINACGGCAKKVDFLNQDILDAIHVNLMDLEAHNAKLNGMDDDYVQALVTDLNNHRPIAGFVFVENSGKDRPKAIKAYKAWAKKKGIK